MSSKEEKENLAPAPPDDESAPEQKDALPDMAVLLPGTSTRPTIKNN